MSELNTTPEVAERLRTTPETVRYWRRRGTGPTAIRVGKRVLYRAEDVDAWLAARPTAGGPAQP